MWCCDQPSSHELRYRYSNAHIEEPSFFSVYVARITKKTNVKGQIPSFTFLPFLSLHKLQPLQLHCSSSDLPDQFRNPSSFPSPSLHTILSIPSLPSLTFLAKLYFFLYFYNVVFIIFFSLNETVRTKVAYSS